MDTTPEDIVATSHNSAFTVLMILFALSLSLNVWLGAVVRSNRLPVHSLTPATRMVEAATGGQPRFSSLRDLDGHPFGLSPSHNRLIYFFSPTCKWCDKNLASIQNLASQIAPKYDIVGIVQSPDSMAQYLARHPLQFKVVVDDDPYDMKAMDFRGTPQTVLVVDGRVAHNWPGAFQGKVKESIQNTLGVSIPDMIQSSK
jgi:peroxiredoxin